MPPQTQNRRDLLQAYRLMTRRTALALVVGEPDSPNQPLRRRNMATISGILAGVIACAAFGVLGMLSPGPVAGLTKPGTLVIDKDTATPYVPCQASGEQKLCPALNYASALLALNTTSVSRVDVTQATLSNYKIGPTLGIAGLPQDLPISADLVKGPWSVCEENGVSTLVGGAAVGGAPLTAQDAELVRAQGQNWVLWNGTRMKIPTSIMTVLWPHNSPQSVSSAWLNAIPEEPDFTPPVIPGQAQRQHAQGPKGNALVGQVYFSQTAQGKQNYVLDASGKLDPLTQEQAELLEFEPHAPSPQAIDPAAAAADVGSPIPVGDQPQSIPGIPRFTSPVCVSYGAGMSRTITTGGTIPANAENTGVGGSLHVDRVWLPQGHGALIGETASADGQSRAKAWFLLIGATRYGLAGSAVADKLGYDLTRDQTVLPASLADVLPEGPALDPSQVKQQMSG